MTYIYDPQLDDLEYYLHDIEQESQLSILGGPALPALGHAISGATGSAISNVLTYPLALSITRLQVQHQFNKHRSPSSSSFPPSTSSDDKNALDRQPPSEKDEEDYKSIPDALRRIYAEEGGLPAFYEGCVQDTLKSMADSFLFFLAYNFVRSQRLHRHSSSQGKPAKKLPVLEELAVGMVSGAFSKFFTTPVQQIVTRKQTARMVAKRAPPSSSSSSSSSSRQASADGQSSADLARQIYAQKGLVGFWSGYSASLVLTLNPSLTMLFHETLVRIFVKRDKRDNPGAKMTFLLAALSKALASTITYPFSLAKSRAQVSARKPLDNNDDGDRISGKESAREMEKKAARKVRKDTIFDTVVRIAREEGLGGLYQGLSGEVLKGFFSHGLTMLMKEGIHKVVIQLYYLLLKAIKRYPSSDEIAKMAGKKIGDVKDAVVEAAGEAKDAVVEAASNVSGAVGSAAGNGNGKNGWTAQSQQVLDKTVHSVAELYRRGKQETADFLDDYIPEFDDDDNGWGW